MQPIPENLFTYNGNNSKVALLGLISSAPKSGFRINKYTKTNYVFACDAYIFSCIFTEKYVCFLSTTEINLEAEHLESALAINQDESRRFRSHNIATFAHLDYPPDSPVQNPVFDNKPSAVLLVVQTNETIRFNNG